MNVVRWTMGLAVIAVSAGPALAQTAVQTAFNYDLTSYECADSGCAEPSCGAEDICGPDISCGNECGCGSGCSLCDCNLGEPCKLKDALDPCDECGLDFGGWMSLGYHSDNTRLSREFNDLRSFNDVPDQLNLHQAWLYFEKVAEAPCRGVDWGFRFDIMYGTDAQKTQAFGNDDNNWDVSFDNGEYGWAMPQAYVELAFGDWSWKLGHFFTLIGYEVVPAPGNFFYSHAFTMFNSEPFTHTGAIGTYSGIDGVDVYAGWTFGWDTGFDQALGGSSWLGGFSTEIMDDVTFTYMSTAGNFGLRSGGENGYSHSLLFDVQLSDSLNYVCDSDLVTFDDEDISYGHQVGLNQYLFYSVNDRLALGTRVEWWKSNGMVGETESASFYGWTYGLNYRPSANMVIRPEVRHNWCPGEDNYINENGTDFNQTVFGCDVIMTF